MFSDFSCCYVDTAKILCYSLEFWHIFQHSSLEDQDLIGEKSQLVHKLSEKVLMSENSVQ